MQGYKANRLTSVGTCESLHDYAVRPLGARTPANAQWNALTDDLEASTYI